MRKLYYNLCLIILRYKFNGHRFIYKLKRHAQKVCIFNKKECFFLNENKIIIQNDYEGKSWSA